MFPNSTDIDKAVKVESFFQAISTLPSNVSDYHHKAFLSVFNDMVDSVNWDSVGGNMYRPLEIIFQNTGTGPYIGALLDVADKKILKLKAEILEMDEHLTTSVNDLEDMKQNNKVLVDSLNAKIIELDEVKKKNEDLQRAVLSLKQELQNHHNNRKLYPSST